MGSERPERPVFCGNFEYEAEERDIIRLFEKFGRVERIDMKTGFAFVYMRYKDDGDEAIRRLDRTEFGYKRRLLRVEWAQHKESDLKRDTRPSKTLFVVNFDVRRTTERDIERYFSRYGRLTRIQIKKNYAFVQFPDVESAVRALERTNGSQMDGRTLTVEYVQNEDPNLQPDFRDRGRDRSRSRSRDRGGRGGRGRSPSRSPPRYDRRASPARGRRSPSRSPPPRRGSPPRGGRSPSRSPPRGGGGGGGRRASPPRGRRSPSRSPPRRVSPPRGGRSPSQSPPRRASPPRGGRSPSRSPPRNGGGDRRASPARGGRSPSRSPPRGDGGDGGAERQGSPARGGSRSRSPAERKSDRSPSYDR